MTNQSCQSHVHVLRKPGRLYGTHLALDPASPARPSCDLLIGQPLQLTLDLIDVPAWPLIKFFYQAVIGVPDLQGTWKQMRPWKQMHLFRWKQEAPLSIRFKLQYIMTSALEIMCSSCTLLR